MPKRKRPSAPAIWGHFSALRTEQHRRMPIPSGQMSYLHLYYPFLQIMNLNADPAKIVKPEITVFQDWNIHDGGDAISCSLSKRPWEQQLREGQVNHGTIQQSSRAVCDYLVSDVATSKWAGVYVVFATSFMVNMIYLASLKHNVDIQGVVPDQSTQDRYQKILKQEKDWASTSKPFVI